MIYNIVSKKQSKTPYYSLPTLDSTVPYLHLGIVIQTLKLAQAPVLRLERHQVLFFVFLLLGLKEKERGTLSSVELAID